MPAMRAPMASCWAIVLGAAGNVLAHHRVSRLRSAIATQVKLLTVARPSVRERLY